MSRKKNRVKFDSGTTLIAANCVFDGNVQFSDQLLIYGTVNGRIHATADSNAKVTVGESGVVKGDIQVPQVLIGGEVLGDIRSSDHIELAARSRVTGDVYYQLLEVVEGARMIGQMVYAQGEISDAGDASVKNEANSGKVNKRLAEDGDANIAADAVKIRKAEPTPISPNRNQTG